jgi:predicted RNA-binding Zn-ribbon protein involved in translation (DUF1610 family)
VRILNEGDLPINICEKCKSTGKRISKTEIIYECPTCGRVWILEKPTLKGDK